MLERLKQLNRHIEFCSADNISPLYKKVDGDYSDLVELASALPLQADNCYIADDTAAKTSASVGRLQDSVFAELPVQAGWCFGGNRYMNGFEWHKSSEVVVACTDCALLLGDYADIKDDTYDSGKAIALYLGKGEAVELMPLTLHLAPLPTDNYFATAIILPQGTNLPLSGGIKGARRAVNKWLLVHKDNKKGIELGSKVGVIGDNITLIT